MYVWFILSSLFYFVYFYVCFLIIFLLLFLPQNSFIKTLLRLTPHPFNLCSNADSIHTYIFRRQPLDMTWSICTQLIWSTMVRPVLSGTCPVKPLYGLGHSAAAQFQGVGNLVIAEAIFMWSNNSWGAMLNFQWPVWESVRAITPNLTHLLPIHTWDLVTLTSHMTLGRKNGELGPIWTFSLRGVLTFVASGWLCVELFWGDSKFTLYTDYLTL